MYSLMAALKLPFIYSVIIVVALIHVVPYPGRLFMLSPILWMLAAVPFGFIGNNWNYDWGVRGFKHIYRGSVITIFLCFLVFPLYIRFNEINTHLQYGRGGLGKGWHRTMLVAWKMRELPVDSIVYIDGREWCPLRVLRDNFEYYNCLHRVRFVKPAMIELLLTENPDSMVPIQAPKPYKQGKVMDVIVL